MKCNGEVVFKKKQGKGNAIRKNFPEVDTDVFIMVDADLTYSEKDLQNLLKPVIKKECYMCVGNRYIRGNYFKEVKKGII